MSKLFRTAAILGVVALFGAGCAKQTAQPYAAPTAQAPEQSTDAVVGQTTPVPEAVVEYKDGTFNPATLRVLVGTKVTFVNKGTKAVWPASGMHPTHLICPGFDALKGLKSGETYSYVFSKPSECPFHNHLAPSEHGSIEVMSAE